MATAAAEVLSAQEEAIASGKRTLQPVSDRILRMTDAIRKSGEPRISLDRAVAFTESFKTTEGQPTVTRWGKALLYMAEHLPVRILDDELIVGRLHGYWGRCAPIWPELDGSIWSSGGEFIMKNQGNRGIPVLTPEDKKIIDESLTPFWSTRDYKHAVHKVWPEETRRMFYGPDPKNVHTITGVMTETGTVRSSQQWVGPYEAVLTQGCKAMKEKLKERLASPDVSGDAAKKAFLEAAMMSLDALVMFAKRYAKLASEMAAKEKDTQRRKELEEIASACDWAPEKPARSFREALQVQWFIQFFTQIEQNVGGGQQSGRMDQYLGSYYDKDIAAGKITREAATELLQCVWLNMWQQSQVKMGKSAAAGNEGYAHFELITLGGTTPEGQDATNELTYVILESTRPLQAPYPDVGVRIHAKTPDKLLRAVADTIKDGKGNPKLFNDQWIIPFYLMLGCTQQEANNYTPTSCADSRVMERETHNTGNGGYNWGATVELMLRNGKIKFFDDAQYGIATGDPRTFTTFDDAWLAFKIQLEHLVKHTMIMQVSMNSIKAQYMAAPFSTLGSPLLTDACMDVHDHVHAAGKPGAIDLTMIESIGFATAIDSMAAIKHLIYDTKKLTWDQLLDALEKNWEGKEAIRQLCLNAPKYGNAIEWVDKLGWEMERIVVEYCDKNRKEYNQPFVAKCVPVTYHVPLGKVIMATPNGRPAGEYLADGVAPSHGMDTKGPTSSLNSIARAHFIDPPGTGPELLNMKFAPMSVAGEAGTKTLMQFIRVWSNLKIWHVQFNILNRDTMLAAQKEPEKYRDLIVRIAGYSAYFVDLSPELQAEILARTEQQV